MTCKENPDRAPPAMSKKSTWQPCSRWIKSNSFYSNSFYSFALYSARFSSGRLMADITSSALDFKFPGVTHK